MRHIVRKLFWNFEKEEAWLNHMAAQGKALLDYTWGRYVFEDAPCSEYIYRIELLDKVPSHPDSQKYIAFVEETGAVHIATYMRWVYFRKKAADGPFELYSDSRNKLVHYKRVTALWTTLGLMDVSIGSLNLTLAFVVPLELNVFHIVLGSVMLGLGILFLLIGTPARHQMRRLKREMRILEG